MLLLKKMNDLKNVEKCRQLFNLKTSHEGTWLHCKM